MENRLQNPIYSEIHSEVLHDPQGFRNPPEEKEKESQEKKARTKIPVSKFKQTVEKVKEDRRRDTHDKQSRRSSIPKLKDKPTPENKPPKLNPKTENLKVDYEIADSVENKANNVEVINKDTKDNINVQTKENCDKEQSNKSIKNTSIPLLVKRKVEKFKQKRDAKKGVPNANVQEKHLKGDNNELGNEVQTVDNSSNSYSDVSNKVNDNLDSNVDGYSNTNSEINAEEQQVIDEFDKIYEDIGDSEEPDSFIDEIVENINVDPENLVTKFDEIVHDYDDNIIQLINVENTKSKIPLLKQKSLHEVPVAKIADRRLSLKNISFNDDNDSDISDDSVKDKKGKVIIDNKALQSKDPINLKETKDNKNDYKFKTPEVKPPNAIKETNKQTIVDEEIKTVNNIETVQYDNNVIVTEEIKLVEAEKKPVDKKPADKQVKETVKVVTPVFDKPKTVDIVNTINNDNNVTATEHNKIGHTDQELQDNPVKETVKVDMPIFEDMKTPDNVETINYDNNVIVTEEIKIVNAEKKDIKEKDPIHILKKKKAVKKDSNTNICDEKSPNIIEENEVVPVFEEIKTINNVETIEYNNNQIVTEEIKLINLEENKGELAHKNDDSTFSKVPDSTKMVQNLLSQMGTKTKEEIPSPSQNKDDFNDHSNISDKQDNQTDVASIDISESIIDKLINKIKNKDQEMNNNFQESLDEMPKKASVKSKIDLFNKDKITKPTQILKPWEELNEGDQIPVKDKKKDIPQQSNNKNIYVGNLKEVTAKDHEKTKHDNHDRKESKLDTELKKSMTVSNDKEIILQKHFKDPTKVDNNLNKTNINNKSTDSLHKNVLVENSNDHDLENETEDYIPKGKVSSIINNTRIGSNDNKEPQRPESILELPKKKSVLSRITMFERQASKEPAAPKPHIDSRTKDIPTSPERKPKIVDEVKPKDGITQPNLKPKIVKEIEKEHTEENLNYKQESNINEIYVKKKTPINDKPTTIDAQKEIEEKRHHLEQNTKEYQNDKPKIRNASNIIAKFERSIENQHFKRINSKNEQIKKDYKEKDSIYKKNVETISVNDKYEVNKEITGNKNVEVKKKLIESPSLAELDLGNAVKGKVKQLIVRISSKENIYQDFEKKETISIKEMPRKRTVFNRIALFEKKITAIPTERPLDLTPPTTTKQFFATNPTTENIERTTSTKKTLIDSPNTTTGNAVTSTSTERVEPQRKEEEFRKIIEDMNRAKRRFGSVDLMPTVKLSNGQEMPVLAVGTAMLNETLLPHIIKAAIDLGYRAFDTAYIYGNQKAIGEAIRQKIDEGVVRRDQLFIINKLWSTFHRTDLVEKACRNSLETMGLDYFDLYLVHNPMSFKEGDDPIPKIANVMQYSESDYMDAWYGMENLVKKGLTRSIGLSNFNSTQVVKIYDKSAVKPVINQVECHPYLTQYPLELVCGDRNILLSCFGVLGSKGTPASFRSSTLSAIDDPLLVTMAAGLNMTTAQLLIRYQLDRGHTVVVKASSAVHLWDNLQSLNYQLNDSHIAAIDALNRNKRTFSFQGMGDTHRNYPFKA